MPDHIPLPAKQYSVIYADPPWAYSQGGNTKSSHGIAKQHYPTMTTAEICALPVREIVRGGAACFMWATFPNITEAIKVMEAWGFTYKTAAFVWVKKNRKQGGNFMGLLHDVCKAGVYHIERKRRRNPETGVWEDYLGYTFRDPLPLGHGEKSLYQIARFIRLEDHEALAIRWHMGAYDTAARTDLRDLSAAMDATPWVWRLHEADMCAAHIDERGTDE